MESLISDCRNREKGLNLTGCLCYRQRKILQRTLVSVLNTFLERFRKFLRKVKKKHKKTYVLPAGRSISAPFESVCKQTSEPRLFCKQSNFTLGKYTS